MGGHGGGGTLGAGGHCALRHPQGTPNFGVTEMWGRPEGTPTLWGRVGDRRCRAFLAALVLLNHYLAFQFFAHEYYLFSEVSALIGPL